jgi:hypothetical protein
MKTSLPLLLASLTFSLLAGCGMPAGGTDGPPGPPDMAGACTPSCGGRTCGSNGCGGTCGTCAPTAMCSGAGACVPITGNGIQVDATATNGNIHPEVYGLAFADGPTLTALNVPLNRWGGNSTTRYNWQLDVHNVGNDYYFENIVNDGSGTYGTSSFTSSADLFVAANKSAHADTLMTIPTIGWAPKDRIPNHPFTCGYSVTKYGPQDSVDPYDTNCGNGKHGGAQITGNAADTSVAALPAFEAQWLAHLTGKFGASGAGSGGIRYYQLDNEMNLWGSTHVDVHPAPVNSDEVWQATLQYAPVIKAADPAAVVLGYTSWGVLDLFLSNLDTTNNNRNDQTAHGGVPLAQWYLGQLKKYEQQNGKRLVDCLDLHYYPQGGSSLENTRSLWDTTYRDPSWVDSFLGEPVKLFPRIQGWIAAAYPGTDVCVSEYNFDLNNEDDPKAALAEADVLGIYGRYGVRLAAYWTTPVDGQGKPKPPYYAFQLYRSYDGQGATFGSVSVGAATTLDKVSVYAATDPGATTVTVVVVNKATTAVDTNLALAHFTPAATARAYQYVAQGGAKLSKIADVTVAGGQLPLHLPALSMTLVAIPKG